MSSLRPECGGSTSNKPALSRRETLLGVYRSVQKRRSLIHGKLEDKSGKHCALGCFWEDKPHALIAADIVDEIAAVNDSVPPMVTPGERWRHVNRWLKWQLRAMGIRA